MRVEAIVDCPPDRPALRLVNALSFELNRTRIGLRDGVRAPKEVFNETFLTSEAPC
jgi:hypothetical protein